MNAMKRNPLALAIWRAMATWLAVACVLLLAACTSVPNVPKTVTVTVTEYRQLPDWVAPVPIYQRDGGTVGAHLTAECRHKTDQAIANCRISAARRISAGQPVDKAECERAISCADSP